MADTGERKARRRSILPQAATVFLVAGCALVLEIVAVRLIAPYVGMSLYSWTAVIATVLAGLSLGHGLGGLLAGDPTRLAPRTAAVLAVGALATLAVPPLLRLLAPRLLGTDAEVMVQVGLLSLILFALPAVCAGAVSPLATRAALARRPDRPGPVLGAMYAAGALGSILGTLAGGFLFVPLLGSITSVLVVAAVLALLAALHLLARPAGLAALLALLVAMGGTLLFLAHRRGALADPCLEESRHFCIRVDDATAFTGRPSRLLVLDHLVHGINDRDDPTLLHSPYLAAIDARVRAALGPRPFTAFHLGGGAYTLPRAWQGRARLQVVAELDPAVTRIARDRLWFRPDSRLRILHDDGRRALRRLSPGTRFDVVVVDAFRDIAVPFHLLTREFFAEVAARLAEDGLLLLNVVDRRREPRLAASVARTLREVFPMVESWLEAGEAELLDGRVTWLLVAGRRPVDPPSLLDDRHRSGYAFRRVTPRITGEPIRLTDDRAPVELLLADVLRRPELAE